jgi:hypothetical protein
MRRHDLVLSWDAARRLSADTLGLADTGLPTTCTSVTGNRLQRTGDSMHGLNQRREASQVSRTPPRKRHEGPGGFLEATTKAKLLRLAHHRNCSVPALIGDLAASAG